MIVSIVLRSVSINTSQSTPAERKPSQANRGPKNRDRSRAPGAGAPLPETSERGAAPPLRLSPTARAVVFLRAVVRELLQLLLLPLPIR